MRSASLLLLAVLLPPVSSCMRVTKPAATLDHREFLKGASPEASATRPLSVRVTTAPAGGPAAPAPAAGAAHQIAPAPATRPARGASLGTYMIVGTVLAEVNGQPIYADKVLARLDADLRAQARRLDPQQFRKHAASVIRKQVEELIRDELEFAAAQRSNSDEERDMAAHLTFIWRQREITKAGGSLAVARQRWLNPPDGSQGVDFDEKVMEQYRLYMVLIHYQRHIWPRVQVSADDMRRFYDRYRDELFVEKPAIRFRRIRIEVRGDREKALARAREVREKALRGEDFGELASAYNDNRLWAKNRGYMELVEEKPAAPEPPAGEPDILTPPDQPAPATMPAVAPKVPAWYLKGSLRAEKLEKALFELEPGQITEVIEDGNGFDIGKLEEKRPGRVREFEDPQVQQLIRRRLETEQRQQLRQKEQRKLMELGIWRIEEKNLETAVEMAMQKYYAVAGEGR